MWSDVFAVPGTRTTGGVERDFLVAAPGWSGDVLEGLELLTAPTPMVGHGSHRVERTGRLPSRPRHPGRVGAHSAERWGSEGTSDGPAPVDPDVDDEIAPLHQVNALRPGALIAYGAELMKVHPPHPFDHPVLERMRALGFEVGGTFDVDGLPLRTREAVKSRGAAALADLVAATNDGSLGSWTNGWMTIQGGTYGSG